MTILKEFGTFTPAEKYIMTRGAETQKMRDAVGQEFKVKKVLLYTEVNAKEVEQTVMSVMTEDNDVYATNSRTFISELDAMITIFDGKLEDLPLIRVLSGTSKAGRSYITCTLIMD